MPQHGCLSTAYTFVICSFVELILHFMSDICVSDTNLTNSFHAR